MAGITTDKELTGIDKKCIHTLHIKTKIVCWF